MEKDCTVHIKMCLSGAVTFIAVVSRNDDLYINHICCDTKHSTKD
jgi:hypothetical protein